jgi:hypothetical protein
MTPENMTPKKPLPACLNCHITFPPLQTKAGETKAKAEAVATAEASGNAAGANAAASAAADASAAATGAAATATAKAEAVALRWLHLDASCASERCYAPVLLYHKVMMLACSVVSYWLQFAWDFPMLQLSLTSNQTAQYVLLYLVHGTGSCRMLTVLALALHC